ncbi:YvrJ family protein [Salicibibacter halophilus]|uniref:YvrJ family protein n=1 Tax=Salicibibacter halophilus TaxID=2502791 RepID=A0A514LLF6_9BACI|nr:YvrJ family protein [Salicibibacter halophilus]QDI92702.1 YvrJ family protein [Salicibibacter halophilus]
MEEWMSLLFNHGFAAVVAFYLLHRMEKKLDLLINAVCERPANE